MSYCFTRTLKRHHQTLKILNGPLKVERIHECHEGVFAVAVEDSERIDMRVILITAALLASLSAVSAFSPLPAPRQLTTNFARSNLPRLQQQQQQHHRHFALDAKVFGDENGDGGVDPRTIIFGGGVPAIIFAFQAQLVKDNSQDGLDLMLTFGIPVAFAAVMGVVIGLAWIR